MVDGGHRRVLHPVTSLRGPDDIWEQQIGVMADVLDAEAITGAVAGMRDR
jgi:hypothetical protein